MPGSCCPLSDLERLLAELLPADEFEAVSSHIEGCTICQQRLEKLQQEQRRDLPALADRHQALTVSEPEVLERIKQRGHEPGEPPHESLRPTPPITGFPFEEAPGVGGIVLPAGTAKREGIFLGWLASILLNRIKQWLRFWHRDRRCEVAFGTSVEPVVHHAAPDESQEWASLQRALAALNEDDRRLLVLKHEGLSHAEIAARLGIRDDAACERFERALVGRLREIIAWIDQWDRRGAIPRKVEALTLWRFQAMAPEAIARQLVLPTAAVTHWVEEAGRKAADPDGWLRVHPGPGSVTELDGELSKLLHRHRYLHAAESRQAAGPDNMAGPEPGPTETHHPAPGDAAPPDFGGWFATQQIHLIGPLDGGGMAAVFLAWHGGLKREVVLKVARNPANDERFRREITIHAKLGGHPHLAVVRTAGEHQGRPYLVLDHVVGVDLHKLVAARGPLPFREACAYVRQAALGLGHAHERRVVHRDVKAANLIQSDEDGGVRVIDWGLAKLDDGTARRDELTHPGIVLGSFNYWRRSRSRTRPGRPPGATCMGSAARSTNSCAGARRSREIMTSFEPTSTSRHRRWRRSSECRWR